MKFDLKDHAFKVLRKSYERLHVCQISIIWGMVSRKKERIAIIQGVFILLILLLKKSSLISKIYMF